MKKQKTKYIKVRMTLEEVEQFKKKAKEYKTVSHYVRRALEEYSNMNIRQQIELMNDLGTFYQKYQNELSWAGSNLNQAMKRANELSVAGLLAPGYLREVLLPTIQETQHTLTLIKRELETLMLKSIRSVQPESNSGNGTAGFQNPENCCILVPPAFHSLENTIRI